MLLQPIYSHTGCNNILYCGTEGVLNNILEGHIVTIEDSVMYHNLVPAVVDSFLEQAAHSTNLLSLGQNLDHKLGLYWKSTHWKMKTAVVEQDAVEQDMLVVPRD